MDTDDLSKETYKAVLFTAEEFNHDLTLQFGMLSYGCSNDNDFLKEAELLIMSWLRERNLQVIIEDIFFDEFPTSNDFRQVLMNILKNISTVKQIPIRDRHFE